MTRKAQIKPPKLKGKKSDMSIKSFVINTGRSLIDISAVVCIIFIFLAGLASNEYAILVIPVGLIVMVVIYYLLYLAIDVRDNLVKLNATVKELSENLLEEEDEAETESETLL